MKLFSAAFVAAIVFNVAIVGAIIFVAVHFLSKVW